MSIKAVKIRSPITCESQHGVCSKCYGLDLATNKPVEEGTAVGIIAAQSIGEPGTQLTMRTFHIGGVAGSDITHGLPRVEELFELRAPKVESIISEVDGKVEDIKKDKKEYLVTIAYKNRSSKKEEKATYKVPKASHLVIKAGDLVYRGQSLTEGYINLKELLKVSGREEVWRYILKEIQRVYVSQGAIIDNKHIEIIIRQMFSKVKIEDAGDSEEFIAGDIVEKNHFLKENEELIKKGMKPAKAQDLMLGITKSAIYSESFLSAASFQETTRVLVSTACEGKPDYLRGLKENVIIGHLIPAGTGFKKKKEEEKKEKK